MTIETVTETREREEENININVQVVKILYSSQLFIIYHIFILLLNIIKNKISNWPISFVQRIENQSNNYEIVFNWMKNLILQVNILLNDNDHYQLFNHYSFISFFFKPYPDIWI